MAQIFQVEGFGPVDEFLASAGRVELIAELDSQATNLEGYLFPETYSLPRDATANDLVEAMVTQFRQVFSTIMREATADLKLSVHEVVTLASLIQKETGNSDEHGLVSAVYNNRLRIGMPLQLRPNGYLCSPTCRSLRRQPDPCKSRFRFAVQYISACRSATRPDRVSRPSRP